MTQTISVTVQLGASQTAKAIGYRVLNLNRTVYSAFTIVNVAETVPLGTYSVSGGVTAPDAGGYIIVGTSGVDIFEFAFDASIVSSVATGVTLADDAITAAKIASNAIDADALASDAVAEIQNGLATSTSLATVASYVDTEVAAIKAKTDNLPSDPADASDIATALATIASYIDTEVAAIKAKTDNLPSDPSSASVIASALATIASYIDTEVAAIKAKTDNLPGAPAAVSDIPTAAAINSALTTAHGSGAWSTATGFATPTNVADAQTAIIDAIADLDALTVEQVQNAAEAALQDYDAATGSDVERIAAIVGLQEDEPVSGILKAIKGVTFNSPPISLTIPSDWVKVYFTVKTGLSLADAAATIQVVKSNPSADADGLTFLNAAVAVTKTDGSLVINQMAGTVVIQIKDNAMAVVPKIQTGSHQYYYDIKILTSDGESTRPHHGHMVVGLTATAAIE